MITPLGAQIRMAVLAGEPPSVVAQRLGCALAEVLRIRTRLGASLALIRRKASA